MRDGTLHTTLAEIPAAVQPELLSDGQRIVSAVSSRNQPANRRELARELTTHFVEELGGVPVPIPLDPNPEWTHRATTADAAREVDERIRRRAIGSLTLGDCSEGPFPATASKSIVRQV